MHITWYILLLWSVGIAQASLLSSNQEIDALDYWLKDADARKALADVIEGRESLLASAYNASLPNFDSLKISKTCTADIAASLQFNTLWRARFVDSSVKVPEGILFGSITHLGNWDECVSVRDKPSSDQTKRLHGQMCLLGLTANSVSKTLRQESAMRNPMHLEMRGVDLSMLAGFMIRLGVCVPSTCKAAEIQGLFNVLFSFLPSVGNTKLAVVVNDADCTTQDKPPLDTSDWVAVAILVFLGVLLFASTTYDVLLPSERKRPLLTAFSVISNGKKLLAAPRPGSDMTLSCLHGIRFLSMCWVVLGHRYSSQTFYPITNFVYYLDFRDDIWRVGIMNGTLSVDTFFVLSGLLVAYVIFKLPAASRRLNVPLFYLHRYIRLTPALAMMVLLNASLINRIGWGPLWSGQMDYARENCQKSWWYSLLYVNNYVDPYVNCLAQAWYLMIDMQLYWLSPLVIFPLLKAPRIGQIIIGVLCISGLIINFVLSYVLDIPGSLNAWTDADKSVAFFKDYYVTAYSRFVPYLEGFALGYYFATLSVDKVKHKKYPLFVSFALWLVVAALLLVPLFLGYYFYLTPLPSRVETAFYNSFSRPMWSLGVIGVIYLCASGNGKPVNIFLSWTGFQILGRFSYGIYLVHIAIMTIEAASTHTYSYLSDSVVLPSFAADLVISILCAAVLNLVCEAPFLVIEKELLGSRNRKENKQNTDNQNASSLETKVENKSEKGNV